MINPLEGIEIEIAEVEVGNQIYQQKMTQLVCALLSLLESEDAWSESWDETRGKIA